MSNREKLEISNSDARRMVYEDLEDFEVIEDSIYDTTRWSEQHEVVVKRESDGKFFAGTYQRGLTEYQDEQPFEYTDPDFIEVKPIEKTITVYGWEVDDD